MISYEAYLGAVLGDRQPVAVITEFAVNHEDIGAWLHNAEEVALQNAGLDPTLPPYDWGTHNARTRRRLFAAVSFIELTALDVTDAARFQTVVSQAVRFCDAPDRVLAEKLGLNLDDVALWRGGVVDVPLEVRAPTVQLLIRYAEYQMAWPRNLAPDPAR